MNQRNTKGQRHGLWECYWSNGKLMYKGSYINDERHGLWEEYYHENGKLWDKGSYLNGKRHGLWEYYHENGQLEKREFYL